MRNAWGGSPMRTVLAFTMRYGPSSTCWSLRIHGPEPVVGAKEVRVLARDRAFADVAPSRDLPDGAWDVDVAGEHRRSERS
jgi:hypothetical protein